MKPWATIAEALAQHGRCAMVTVAETQGSAPREAGARMVVMPDGGFRGTIGGGMLEWRALADARTLLAETVPQARLRRQALGPELGQCCGGSVRLLIEVFDRSMAGDVAKLVAREASGDFATRSQLQPLVPAKAGIQGAPGEEPGFPPPPDLRTSPSTPTFTCSGSTRASTGRAETPDRLPHGSSRQARGRQLMGGALARTIIDNSDTGRPPIEIASDGTVFETFARQTRLLYLFGAGHVGRSLVLALAPLPFDVIWIDPRRDAFPGATPANVRGVHIAEPAAALAAAPPGAFVLVMTHSHALDLEVVHAALASRRFACVGLIGSATKRARFAKRLSGIGLSVDTISQLVCPIGIAGIASKAPAAIAASVAADLLIRHEAVDRCKEAVARAAERA